MDSQEHNSVGCFSIRHPQALRQLSELSVEDVLISKRSSHKTNCPDRTVGTTNIFPKGDTLMNTKVSDVLLHDAHKLQGCRQKVTQY